MIILLMGVTASGKTTVGQQLASQLNWEFLDADDFHSAANVAKMRAGIPLTDEDRDPWLQSLRDAIAQRLAAGRNAILACSALREAYRERLVISPVVKLVFLRGGFSLLQERIQARQGHYMNPRLLESQFNTLEVPDPTNALIVDVDRSVPEIVQQIRADLHV